MPQYSLPQMSLAQAQYNPAVFQGTIHTPQVADISILANSLQNNEKRDLNAIDARIKSKDNIAKLLSMVTPDQEEWANDYYYRMIQDADNEYYNGNYTSAIKKYGEAGANMLSTQEAIGRIKSANKYNEAVKAVTNDKTVDQVTKDRWLEENQHTYEDIKVNGRIVSGKEWEAKWMPTQKLKWDDEVYKAFRLVSPEESTSGDQSDTFGYQRTNHKVPLSKIIENLDTILSDSAAQEQINQEFEDTKYRKRKIQESIDNLDINSPTYTEDYNKLITQLDSVNKMLLKDGSDINDYKTFYEHNITNNVIAKNLAYDNLSYTTDHRTKKQDLVDPVTDPTPNPELENDNQRNPTPGKPVREKTKTSQDNKAVDGATNSMRQMMGETQENSNSNNGKVRVPKWNQTK